MTCVQVSSSAERGQVLICTQDVPAGHVLLVEAPIFLASSVDSEMLDDIDVDLGKMLHDFQGLDHAVQDEILASFFCPMDSRYAVKTKKQVEKFPSSSGLNKELLVRLSVIIHFNCVAILLPKEDGSQPDPSYSGRVGLYAKMCKAAHSCAPNAFWYTVDASKIKEMRSIVPIKRGSEVCLSYLDDEALLLPTTFRRSLLQEMKEFHCTCERCSGDDDTRVFRCAQADCQGTCFVVGHQVGKCEACAIAPSCTHSSQMLAEEQNVQKSLEFIDDVLDNGKQIDVTGLVLGLSLGTLHTNHYLASRIARVQYELFVQLGKDEEAASAMEQRVHQWRKVRPCRGAAFDLEKLGDLFAAVDKTTLAAKSYFRSFEILSLLSRLDNPYVKCIARLCARSFLAITTGQEELARMEGKRVLLVGLAKRTLNGCVGLCGAFVDGRYVVSLGAGSSLKLKPSNLVVLPEEHLAPHSLVVVHGLSSEAGSLLNAHVGTVGTFQGQRWAVCVDGRGLKSVKPDNLFPLPALKTWFEQSSAAH